MHFVKFVYMSQWPTWFENNLYFDKYSTIFMFKVSISIIFCEKYD